MDYMTKNFEKANTHFRSEIASDSNSVFYIKITKFHKSAPLNIYE